MKPVKLSDHIMATYKLLRLGTAVIALAFPLLLWAGGYLLGDLPLEGSMSAYYFAGDGVMRNEFVGILFAIGTIFFLYKGYSRHEDYALNLAGILALGIALFPMPWPVGSKHPLVTAHGFCAVSFFFCIGYVCIFFSADTLIYVKDDAKRDRYRRFYKVLGYLMVGFPILAFILTSIVGLGTVTIFFVEIAGVYVFAAYWLFKTIEISNSNVDQLAASGKLLVTRHGLSDAFHLNRPLQETQIGNLDSASVNPEPPEKKVT